MELLYSSKDFTRGYQDDLPAQKTDFTLEITKWEEKISNTVIVSAKFGGTLKGIFGSSDVNVENGEIVDLPLEIVYENQ